MSKLDLGKSLKSKDVISHLLSDNVSNVIKKEVDINLLIPYRKHPFKLYEDERLGYMIESIKKYGIISPIIVRELEDGKYEVLSGHNRTNAARLIGLKTVPIEIRNVDDDIADIIVVQANFIQRIDFLPSEKARAYKLQLDALNRQGKKNSNLCSNGTEVENSRDIVARNNNTSSVQIQRYIRLNYLTEKLLDMVDNKTLSFRPAVEISHLEIEIQINIEKVIESGIRISLKQAHLLKEEAGTRILSIDDIYELLTENKKDKRKIEIPYDKIKNYFPDSVTEDEIVEKIVGLLNSQN